jgi:hypothetical protein
MAIAADIIKALLVPFDDEPVWMKSLTGVTGHGISRAGVTGVPGMVYDALPVVGNGRVSGLLGPTASQMSDILAVPFSTEHSVISEMVNAAPGATILNRWYQAA